MPVGRPVLSGPPRVAAGQRDRKVVIQQLSTTSGGFPVETWATLGTEMMARRDLRADERFTMSQNSSFAETQWHMSYREDMDPELVNVTKQRRLSHRGRVYDIVAASVIGIREGIELVTIGKVG